MVHRYAVLSAVLLGIAEGNNACDQITWTDGGAGGTTANSCGTHADLGTSYLYRNGGLTQDCKNQADGSGGTAEACNAATANHKANCCTATCSFSSFTAGAAPTAGDTVGTGATRSTTYCGANKVPKASQDTVKLTVGFGVRSRPTSAADAGTCCEDACSTPTVTFNAGAGTASGTNFYCGANRIPVANQASTPSGIATNAGAAAQATVCCNDACDKASFTAGEGTDVAGTTTVKAKYFCGLNKVPNDNQASLDSTSDSISAAQVTQCCSDACGKVTFKAGDGTDDSASTTYYCGENKVPVAKQAEKPSGSNSVGSGQKTTCCDDACGKVTFKAGKGTDDSASTTYYCGENKVPVAKQKDAPSGSDSVGSGQKSKCCAAACSTVTYKAGEGTDKDTTYFCGKNQAPKKDQKTLPCDGSSCSASGKKDCCAATCASTKWAAGKKPKSPASKTMYCGDGMSPKAALADTVCAGEECAEATDAATCCEKKKVNNTTATTDARSTGASVLLLAGVLALSAQ